MDTQQIAASAAIAAGGVMFFARLPWQKWLSVFSSGKPVPAEKTDDSCVSQFLRCCDAIELMRELELPEVAGQIVKQAMPKLAPGPEPSKEEGGTDEDA